MLTCSESGTSAPSNMKISIVAFVLLIFLNFGPAILAQATTDELFKKAKTLSDVNKCEEAAEIYRQVIRLDSKHSRSLAELAACLIDLKQYKEAAEMARESLRIYPNDSITLYNLGTALGQ